MNHNDTTAAGFAAFNQGNHVTIEIPDGQTTYSFRTTEGKRLTVCFLPYRDGEAPQCADIAYNGTEAAPTKDANGHQAFELLAFGKLKSGSRGDQFDTRKQPHPANIACVLMEDIKER